ncbi:MAG: hypothetical protein DWP94_04310 [Flavobacterium sp.]|nr:MAG: hypothetical protein DWP94_04310 [Flavobacterium sp.]
MSVKRLLNLNLVLLLLVISSCQSIQYSKTSNRSLPELGTIGVFSDYLLEEVNHPKTVVQLSTPIRLKISYVTFKKRTLFSKQDSIEIKQNRDSVLTSIEIKDFVTLLKQLNKNKEVLSYLKLSENNSIVTSVLVDLPEEIKSKIENSDESYLIQSKERTLSIELRRENEIFYQIEFSQMNIVDYDSHSFCWGVKSGYKVGIMDLVPKDVDCGNSTYKSARKAERKSQIKF